jgi:hypothetical protein
MSDRTLYHFTCEHGKRGIDLTHILLPNIHPFMKNLGPLLWLTDFAEPPTPESVGLQSRWISCDRLAYRYIVRSHAAVPWSEVRTSVKADVVETLESYGMPEHWWVARRPLTASEFTFDESYTRKQNVNEDIPTKN